MTCLQKICIFVVKLGQKLMKLVGGKGGPLTPLPATVHRGIEENKMRDLNRRDKKGEREKVERER